MYLICICHYYYYSMREKKQNKEMDDTFLWFCLMIQAGVVLHNYVSVWCLKGGCLEFSYHHANKIMACLEINRREPGAILKCKSPLVPAGLFQGLILTSFSVVDVVRMTLEILASQLCLGLSVSESKSKYEETQTVTSAFEAYSRNVKTNL